MAEWNLDVLFVYGDEYRKENLRYLTNYWPIFERAAVVIPFEGEPIILGASEGEEVAKEMSAWNDIRNVKDFTCVTVPEENEYQFARFTSFFDIFKEISSKRKMKRVGLAGLDAMPLTLYQTLQESFKDAELVDASKILIDMRLIKSSNEIECLAEVSRLADIGYQALMGVAVPGKTELQAVATAEFAAREAGAEHIIFMVFGSGKRTATIVGRPTRKVIEKAIDVQVIFLSQESLVAGIQHTSVT